VGNANRKTKEKWKSKRKDLSNVGVVEKHIIERLPS
jgi:hypothetical protein